MLLAYETNITDEGVDIAFDVEFQIEVVASLEDGEPDISVIGVYAPKSDVNLMTSPSPKSRLIGCDIARKAGDDEWVQEQALVAAGISYVGGHNNPDGHWVAEELAERQMRRQFA